MTQYRARDIQRVLGAVARLEDRIMECPSWGAYTAAAPPLPKGALARTRRRLFLQLGLGEEAGASYGRGQRELHKQDFFSLRSLNETNR